MKQLHSRVLFEGLIYPEGVRWSQGRIWCSDVLDRKVYAFEPETLRTEVVVRVDDLPSGLGFLPDGRLLIVTMNERKLLRLDPDGLSVAADLSGICKRLNDMVVGPDGRAYLDAHFESAAKAGLILVDPSGDCRIVATNLTAPNGLAITANGQALVVNDLLAGRIWAFDIALDGSLERQRVFADLDGRSPDGLCLDAEGAAWVGLPFEGKFVRIREGGDITHEIVLQDRWGIAPVLGGGDRRSLYLCTAEVTLDRLVRFMDEPGDARSDCRGWIETVGEVEFPGAGWP
jgi:sugar lactone lactonase YvrE